MAVTPKVGTGAFAAISQDSATRQLLTSVFRYDTQLSTDGISSFTLDIKLARNALVHKYEVVVHAQRASATTAAAVAQIRSTASTAADIAGSGGKAVVLDFGTPRTVSVIEVPPGFAIVRVTPWLGMAFAPDPVYGSRASAGATPPAPGPFHDTVILPSEVRTERLLVEVVGTGSEDELSSQMAVVLPEAPSDIEIRIDGGAPVASFPGPAQPGTDSDLSARTWNKNGERVVDLAAALSKLTGDPTRSDEVIFKVVLSSRVPGELALAVKGPPSLSFVRRVLFGGAETSKELSFAEEGAQEFALAGLPASPVVEEIRVTAVGSLPPERTVPPVGPGDAQLADLVLDPNRAACVRLRSGTGLGEITGLRLPLLAGSVGAEMRAVLWRNKEGGSPEPVEAIEGGVSEPVKLDAGGDAEQWATFSFKRPVPLAAGNPPWAALLVSRGEVRWSLGSSRGNSDPIDGNVVRLGAPTGPWKSLPVPFLTATTNLGTTRGRVRVAGHAPKDAPLAPLVVNLGSRENTLAEVTPSAKGVAANLTFTSRASVASPVLRVVSRVAGNVTLRDVDVVTTT